MSVVQQEPPTRTTIELIRHVEHFQNRVIQDAIADATSAYWMRRAEAFEAARPRPGDWAGRATEADLRAADERCAGIAEACRLRAQWSLIQNGDAA
jgi:hypothetical protein